MKSTVSHLEMISREVFLPAEIPTGFQLKRVDDPGINERYYRAVGEACEWTDRLEWLAGDWSSWAQRGALETWLAFFDDAEVGYVELEKQKEGNVEIVYFGLLPQMIGRGLGGAMLTEAVLRAWEIDGTQRIWLHTCTEDHPHAILNYEKRGFRLFQTKGNLR